MLFGAQGCGGDRYPELCCRQHGQGQGLAEQAAQAVGKQRTHTKAKAEQNEGGMVAEFANLQ